MIVDNATKTLNYCNRLMLMCQCTSINTIISMLRNITVQKNNPDAPPEDVGRAELEGHSDVLPFIANRTSYGQLLLCNEIADTIEF